VRSKTMKMVALREAFNSQRGETSQSQLRGGSQLECLGGSGTEKKVDIAR